MKPPDVADIARVVSIYKRRGSYTIDYLDHAGQRRQRAVKLQRDAKAIRDEAARRAAAQQGITSALTLQEYAGPWLRQASTRLQAQTIENYTWALSRYVLPALGEARLQAIDRATVKGFVAELRPRLSKKSVSIILGVLRACFAGAVEDGLLRANPASALGRRLGLGVTRAELSLRVRAMDREQRDRFFAACQAKAPRQHLLFRLMAVAGLRPGEAYAAQWGDLDLAAAQLHVRRTLSHRRLRQETKTGGGRAVDLSPGLVEALRAKDAATKAAALESGEERAPWVFANSAGEPPDESHVRGRFARVATSAGLPAGFSPHSLRHTYASLLLQAGVSPAYVQEQLGHASIKMTVDVYGRWLRKLAPGAVAALDMENVSKTSATPRAEGARLASR